MKSFSRAAKKLCLTEPAVSIQIKNLEETIGCRLLTRSKKLILTEIGRVVYDYAEKYYKITSDFDQKIHELLKANKNFLALGTTKFLASTMMPKLLTAFLGSDTNLSIRVEEGSSMHIIEGLTEGYHEIAIIGRIPYPKNLVDFIELTSVEVFPIASPMSTLVKRKLRIIDLNDEPLIVRDKDSAIRFNTVSRIASSDFKPKFMIQSGSSDLIKLFVKQNRGYSFLPWFAIERDVKNGTLVLLNIPGLKLSVPVDIVFLKGRNFSDLGERFIEFLKQAKRPTIEEMLEGLKKK